MIYLSNIEAEKILKQIKKGNKEIKTSLNLGITEEIFLVSDDKISKNNIKISIDLIEKISEIKERIFIIDNDNITPLEYSGESYFKLTPTSWGIPTIQISGIKMHRTANIDPWQDTINKVKGIVKKGYKVLDTCTGLGYTAIEARKKGASFVFSVERSIDVHKLCKLNPWSNKFFEDENIFKIIGDSVEQVKLFEDNFFDTIIHDPPRFSIAGDMYSDEFYLNLSRILKKNGKVFHYIGKPDSKFGLKMFKSIKRRMENCNFSIKIENKRYGLVATNKKY